MSQPLSLPPSCAFVAAACNSAYVLSNCSVPSFIVTAALGFVRSSVRKKSGMDIYNLSPIKDVDKSFVPVVRNGEVVDERREEKDCTMSSCASFLFAALLRGY